MGTIKIKRGSTPPYLEELQEGEFGFCFGEDGQGIYFGLPNSSIKDNQGNVVYTKNWSLSKEIIPLSAPVPILGEDGFVFSREAFKTINFLIKYNFKTYSFPITCPLPKNGETLNIGWYPDNYLIISADSNGEISIKNSDTSILITILWLRAMTF